jgi:hypothetical protein
VETPSGPLTPLGPPPRRHFVNTVHSLSQSDLINGYPSSESWDRSMSHGSPYDTLRRTVSSPLLAEGYESRQSMPHSPLVTAQRPRDSQATTISTLSFNTIRESYDRVMSDRHESDDECGTRASLTLSAVRGRPSLSEYSQSSISPTTSLFQEILNRSTSSLNAGPSRFNPDQQNVISDDTRPRYSTMSPPPRMSSSLAHTVLNPPPRSSSLHYFPDGQPQIPPVTVSRPNQPRQSDSGESSLEILAPEPTTPPLPQSKSERSSGRSHMPLTLSISTTSTPIAIHSAPGPSSPTSFFDTIQTQPNAMDDLESSSDEDENGADRHRVQSMDPRNRTMSSSSASQRPSFMRLGNFSTPYLRKGESYRPNLLPIGNNPQSRQPRSSSTFRQPFFIDRKHDVSSSTYDFFKYAQDHPPIAASPFPESSGPRRPSTADHVTVWRNSQRAQESLRRLDGMLIQHMEDEKDTIKRIATTMKQTSPPQISNYIP